MPAGGELELLCQHAEQLAVRRREPISTAHLLLAVAAQRGPAADLLATYRLTPHALEALLHTTVEEGQRPVVTMLQTARDMASRTQTLAAGPLHLLLALLANRTSLAYRVLEQTGVDLARLRTTVLQLAMGTTAPRRLGLPASQPPTMHGGSLPTNAVALSLVPSPRSKRPTVVAPLHDEPTVAVPEKKRVRGPSTVVRGGALKKNPVGLRFALDAKRFPVLSTLGCNLTLAAARGELAPVVGREADVQRCLDVLAKKDANNPLLVGPSGVGKSAVARAVAQASAAAPGGSTDERILVEITLAELVANTGIRGALAGRMGDVRREVAAAARGSIVLVLDDVHHLFASDSDPELSSEIRVALRRGDLPCIGTTTPEGLRRMTETDPSLARCFSPLTVEEISPLQALEVLRAVTSSLEQHHSVHYTEEVQKAAVQWTTRYLPQRTLPEKAIALLDLAGASSHRQGHREVARATLAQVASQQVGVPVTRLLETDASRMLVLESVLAESVVGHSEALTRISALLRRNAAGIHGRRPIGTFLLLGPSGVGKTETAKAIARALFDQADALTRFDFSEFSEPHAVARLLGAPPGYIGHDSGGQLTEAVRKRPYQVILLDEIEKAHRDVLQTFLPVFDEGRLTDGRGVTVDFSHTVFVLTSNLGTSEIVSTDGIGFRQRTALDTVPRVDESALLQAVRHALPPELYNRLDEVLVYHPLSFDQVSEVARRLLLGLSQQVAEARGVRVQVSPEVPYALARLGGVDWQLGARPMKRAMAHHVEAPLAELLLRRDLAPGSHVHVTVTPEGTVRIVAQKTQESSSVRS